MNIPVAICIGIALYCAYQIGYHGGFRASKEIMFDVLDEKKDELMKLGREAEDELERLENEIRRKTGSN